MSGGMSASTARQPGAHVGRDHSRREVRDRRERKVEARVALGVLGPDARMQPGRALRVAGPDRVQIDAGTRRHRHRRRRVVGPSVAPEVAVDHEGTITVCSLRLALVIADRIAVGREEKPGARAEFDDRE